MDAQCFVSRMMAKALNRPQSSPPRSSANDRFWPAMANLGCPIKGSEFKGSPVGSQIFENFYMTAPSQT